MAKKKPIANVFNDPESASSCDARQTLLPLDKALAELKSQAISINVTESVALKESLGRVLADNLFSHINVPPADNSAMDGYAINTADILIEDSYSEYYTLLVSQRVCAGEIGEILTAKTAARIFTGAPIPEGADAVIMQEDCEYDPSDNTVSIKIAAIKKTVHGTNIRRMGEDIQSGAIVLHQGQKLRAQDIGLAASIGVAELVVKKRLKVAVFFTGDELCEPGGVLQEGQIYNSNRYTLTGLLKSIGCEIIDLGIIKDTLEATIGALKTSAGQADLVMTSGGVSVGEEDHMRAALEKLGELSMWRVNIKPGKPFVYGKINTEEKSVPFIGLPGNPVSVFVTYCVFAHPYILKSQGANCIDAKSYKVPSGFDLKANTARNEYLRARLNIDAKGQSSLSLYSHQGSGVLSSASWANGLVFMPVNSPIKTGDMLEFTPFSEFSVV